MLCCLFGTLAVGVSACGDDDDGGGGGGTVAGGTLTVYSSLPLQGTAEVQTTAINEGAQLALKQRRGKAGKFRIKFLKLDDSLASTGAADKGKGARNARTAVRDKSVIAFIGPYNSGVAEVQIPITNKAGLLQVSPVNTYVGLTTDKPGSEPDEPEKYYPTGERNYARIVPIDDVQGAALVHAAKEAGCKQAHLFNSKTTYSSGLNRNIELAAKKQGRLEITGNEGIDPKAPSYRSLVAKVNADCVIATVEAEFNGVQLMKDLGTALPDAKLFESDGFVTSETSSPKKGLPAKLAPRVKATIPTLDIASFGEKGKKFLADYRAEFGKDPDPYGIYGYETMSLILDSIEAVGDKGNDRQAVIDQVFKRTKGRDSALGTYDIDENGDTSLSDYGLYRVEDGKWTFETVLRAGGLTTD